MAVSTRSTLRARARSGGDGCWGAVSFPSSLTPAPYPQSTLRAGARRRGVGTRWRCHLPLPLRRGRVILRCRPLCHLASLPLVSSPSPFPLASLSSTTYPPCEQGLTAVVVVVGVGVTPVPCQFIVVPPCPPRRGPVCTSPPPYEQLLVVEGSGAVVVIIRCWWCWVVVVSPSPAVVLPISSPSCRLPQCRHSTHHPPHEQLLVRLEVGGASFVVGARCRGFVLVVT
jgi:hypothetical protein